MNTTDRKNEVIKMLQSSNDEQLIEEVYELLHANEAIEGIALDELPDELRNKITRALDDYKNGHYITHQEMKQKVQQWLIH